MLGVLVDIDGKKKRIDFTQSTIDCSGRIGCLYVTEDKKEQKAIESLDRFNSGYRNQIWTEDVEEESVEEEPVMLDEKPQEVKKVRKTRAKAE